MASKVNPTPTLTGADADIFIQKLNTPSTDEEIKALERAKNTFEKIRNANRHISSKLLQNAIEVVEGN